MMLLKALLPSATKGILFLFCWLFSFLFFTYQVSAFGITPAETELKNVLSNQTVKGVVYVSRGNPSHDLMVQATLEGEASSYIFPLNGNELFLPKGQSLIPFYFEIRPKSLPPGVYTATVKFEPLKNGVDDEKKENKIQVGAKGVIRFEIVNRVVHEYWIQDVFFENISTDQPITLSIVANNNGNIDEKFSKIVLEIIEKNNVVFSKKYSYDLREAALLPAHESKEIEIKTNWFFEPAVYKVNLAIYDTETDAIVFKKETIKLLPEDVDNQKDILQSTASLYGMEWLYGLAFIMVFALSFTIIKFILAVKTKK